MGSSGVARLCWELLSCFSQRGHSCAEQSPQMTTSQSHIGAGEVLVVGDRFPLRPVLILAGGTAWRGGAGGGGGLESWFQTHSAPWGGPGAWQLWFTHVRPALTAPVHTGGDWVRERLAGGPKLRKLGLAFRPPTPAPRAECSHFLKSESPPGDSEPPEGTRQAHMAMQRPQQPCVTRRWGPDADSPGV